MKKIDNELERKKNAKKFKDNWLKKDGYEKGETHKFWMKLLEKVYNVKDVENYINFEDGVRIGRIKFIDAIIKSKKVIIEQKSKGIALDEKEKQSDGIELTPIEQGRRYAKEIYNTKGKAESPEWLIACNFSEFWIYDLNKPIDNDPVIVKLEELDEKYNQMDFLLDNNEEFILAKEEKVSIEAGELIGKLYDALTMCYENIEKEKSLHSLNVLCVRIVFCLYAEDAGLFEEKDLFTKTFRGIEARNYRQTFKEFFKVLNTEKRDRDTYVDKELNKFPYVNGGLFEEEDIEIPQFTEEIKNIIVKDCGEGFNWSSISPTIFGAIFESTLNRETRKQMGMHFTSIKNIHKVIDPLFLDDLKKELNKIINSSSNSKAEKIAKFEKYTNKLASLTFFDPAAGSGNFLTETYIELRKLENIALEKKLELSGKSKHGKLISIEGNDLIKVKINQFYGIEINDFAVDVAKAAMWIAEHQALLETEEILCMATKSLPLHSYERIKKGNALTLNWKEVTDKKNVSYIISNPPFIGKKFQSKEQKEEIKEVFGYKYKNIGTIDYVCCWFKKAADYIKGTETRAALVGTNSICQGELVSLLWDYVFSQDVEICFAWKSFIWISESVNQANVFCVIVGLQDKNISKNVAKYIFEGNEKYKCEYINGYLQENENISIKRIPKALCNVLKMTDGNVGLDGNYFKLNANEYQEIIKSNPLAKKYIKKLTGSKEYINKIERYVIWLVGCEPSDLKKMPFVLERVEKVKECRLNSPDKGTNKLANRSTEFRDTRNPKHALIFPRVSSGKRGYVPLGFIGKDTICLNSACMIADADLYYFGMLSSVFYMSWMRYIGGKLKEDYRGSVTIVYNNFPFPIDKTHILTDVEKELIKEKYPTVDKTIKEEIEKLSDNILKIREKYKSSTYADMYNENTMPKDLRVAHTKLDKCIAKIYGFKKLQDDENSYIKMLIKLYKMLCEKTVE